jgi:hypothetical protein
MVTQFGRDMSARAFHDLVSHLEVEPVKDPS